MVVATVAFGMGIDKPDVRFVVPLRPAQEPRELLPGDRARRARRPARRGPAALQPAATSPSARSLIERGGNPEQVRIELHKLNAMVGFAEATTCRRRVLLGYLGEPLDHDCGNCDVCLDPPETYDATEHARMALSCVYRLRQGYGIGYVIDVLRGSGSEKIFERGHDQLSTYGIGADRARTPGSSSSASSSTAATSSRTSPATRCSASAPAAAGVLRGETPLRFARPRVHPKPGEDAQDPALGRAVGFRRRRGAVRAPARTAPRDRERAERARLRRLQRQDARRHGRAQAGQRRRVPRRVRRRRGEAAALRRRCFSRRSAADLRIAVRRIHHPAVQFTPPRGANYTADGVRASTYFTSLTAFARPSFRGSP